MPKQRHLHISLSAFLNLIILWVSVICIISMLAFPLFWFQRLIYEQTENYCTKISVQTREGLGQVIKNFDGKFSGFIENDTIYNGMCKNENPDAGNWEFRSALLSFFSTNSMDYYYIKSVELYVKQTGGYFSFGSATHPCKEPFQSDYHTMALSTPLTFNWMGYNEQYGNIEIVKLIYDASTYEELGLLVIRLSPNFFLDEFKNFDGLDIKSMYLLDQSGRILSSIDLSLVNTHINDKYLKAFGLGTSLFRMDGLTFISSSFRELSLSIYNLPYSGWRIVIEVEDGTLYRNLNQTLAKTGILAVVIFILSALFTYIFSNRITKPIDRIVRGFMSIEHEDYTTCIPDNSAISEISTITNGFNHMVAHLNRLINTVYREKLAADELRFKSLQARINPHFLFNTLQLISWKAHAHQADDVCDMIKSLSYMIECNLADDDVRFSTLAEEMKYIRNYVFIIQCKYEDKISISLDIPPDLMNLCIPKLTLQPILENAVSHGVAQKIDRGNIWVKAVRDGAYVIFTIEDDGDGISTTRLNDIRLSFLQNGAEEQTPDPGLGGHNIALKNIKSRLSILYGDRYAFDIQSQPFQGTQVTVKIPYMTMEECGYDENIDR